VATLPGCTVVTLRPVPAVSRRKPYDTDLSDEELKT
jgi:hypothetical protein